MFKPCPMVRLHTVILKRDERAVLEYLGGIGAVQLIHTPAGPDTAPLEPDDLTLDNSRCESILSTIQELRNTLGTDAKDRKIQATALTIEQAEKKLKEIQEQLGPSLELRRQLMEKQGQIDTVCDHIHGYSGFQMPLEESDNFSFIHFATGSIPIDKIAPFIKEAGAHVTVIPVTQHKGRQSFIAITRSADKSSLEHVLQNWDFQPYPLPVAEDKTVDTLYREKQEEKQYVLNELRRVNTELKAFGTKLESGMEEIAESAETELLVMKARSGLPRTESTLLVNGWLPSDESDTVKKGLSEVTGGKHVLEINPPDGLSEQVPILLRHPRLLRPFAALVSTYGLPNYREVEPTLLVALSYLIMFGMMFGDIGHGAVLCLLGLAAILVSGKDSIKDVGILLLGGGISSILFGTIYGSFFGLEHFKQYALWQDPLEGNPMNLMYAAIALGIVMISTGLVMNVINRLRRGDTLGALLDKFGLTGLVFYWGALGILLGGAAIRSRGLFALLMILLLGLPLLGWVLKGPLEYLHHSASHNEEWSAGKIVMAILESFIEAFEGLLSYLANTISFVRLTAYSMSHAALLVAAFMVAEEVKHLSFGGTILSVTVVILGNIVAIVLEGIIASVQALRLEYYEFFGKFFSGDGKAFEPFRLHQR